MKLTLSALILLFSLSSLADERGELIFQDDFERSESQEKKDEPGNGWGTNSEKRAKGNKQVDLRNGAMYIYIHKEADHGVSVTQPAEFKDGTVAMKFMLEDSKDVLGLNFADLKFKEVHAGHICMTKIGTKKIEIADLKTGNMKLEHRTARQNKTVTEEQQELLKTKTKSFPHKLEVGKWHNLEVTIAGDTMTVTINGDEAASFSSSGIDHATKRLLRLAVAKDAVVDEIRIWKKK